MLASFPGLHPSLCVTYSAKKAAEWNLETRLKLCSQTNQLLHIDAGRFRLVTALGPCSYLFLISDENDQTSKCMYKYRCTVSLYRTVPDKYLYTQLL